MERLAPPKPELLIVDDDPLITDTLDYVLGREFQVFAADSRGGVQRLLSQLGHVPLLALVDLGLPPTPHRPDEGYRLIAELLATSPRTRIIVLSGQSDESNARHARTLGAIEFVSKPCEPEVLKRMLLRALQFDPQGETTPVDASGIVGDSFAVQKLREQIRQYAPSPFPVLIEGESGSGKELVARALHRDSARHLRPYLALNCAAISPSLVEPTLFGHAKGAFTGAAGPRSGYFEDAQDGSLFLDEIGELPLELQSKLLRVLENGEYQRVGETQSRVSRARVIAATNRDLRRETREGRFRVDLYHRLSVFSIAVPPLRDLGDDKLLLLEHFTRVYAAQSAGGAFSLDPDARQLWMAYRFPGNVRELRNIVIRLVTKHAGAAVGRVALAEELDFTTDTMGTATNASIDRFDPSEVLATAILEARRSLDIDATLKDWERCFIDAAMKLTQGNLTQAARMLGMHRTTLYSRMQALQHGSDGTSPNRHAPV